MQRVAFVFALLAILTLPAIAVAAGSTPAAAPAGSDSQMGASVSIVDFAFQPGMRWFPRAARFPGSMPAPRRTR
jgi:hypothetical protein